MRGATTLWALSLFLVTSSALADVPNDPCMGASAGDACTTLDGQDGSCVDVNGFLTCEQPSGTSGSGTTTTGAGASTSSGGDGGSSDGDAEDDGGCAVSTVGTSRFDASALLALLGLAVVFRRRR